MGYMDEKLWELLEKKVEEEDAAVRISDVHIA